MVQGASGAGKTTLLDVLANRVRTGVVGGDIFTNGLPRDASFQRRIGYVQQQDLHLETATVREALVFSALLRQPKTVSKEEKLQTVEEVIDLLEMKPYAEAVVGVPGEGLNVEQRKRLTIGVELAAKPDLLFFLDEPTSGLDSQTAWSILLLLRKLTNHGQAILCTIHQPSAMLFQQFDRLLLLAAGGRTVYFGDIGENSKTLTSYFEHYGAEHCSVEENPAEWMLRVIGAAPGSTAIRDWPDTWRKSPEYSEVQKHLTFLEQEAKSDGQAQAGLTQEFASPFHMQLLLCTTRVFEQYWRTPSYLYSKLAMCFITVSFWASTLSKVFFSMLTYPTYFPRLCSLDFPFY
jgi:ABC-type multidrug transport system, ATPase component